MVNQLAEMVVTNLSDDEFEALCFLAGEDSANYPGANLGERAKALITKMEGEGRLADFVSTARDIKPEVTWPNV